MLSADRNDVLTRVGSGSPMGELLRRYWHPVAFTDEVITGRTRRARLLGEDLVLFRTADGLPHVIGTRCPHRGASLAYGIVESDGLRCAYHGWLFDGTGACREQPSEPAEARFHERVRADAWPARDLGGLVFAYLGPDPAPALPHWDLFCWDDAIRDVGYATIPCNFLQIMENAVDPHHVEWLHGRYSRWLRSHDLAAETPGTFGKQHHEVAFDRVDYGLLKRRRLSGQQRTDEDWSVGHPLVFPTMLRVGGGGSYGFHIRVPEDDTTTRMLWYTAYRPGGLPVPDPGPVTRYEVPWREPDGSLRVDHVEGQDIMAWVTQGPIADRTREHLGSVDRGVILLRQLYFEQIDRVHRGLDPMGVRRGPDAEVVVDLPQEEDKFGDGLGFVRDFLSAAHARFSPRRAEIARRYSEVGLDVGQVTA